MYGLLLFPSQAVRGCAHIFKFHQGIYSFNHSLIHSFTHSPFNHSLKQLNLTSPIIQSYLYNDDDFNHNFAIAKAANKEYKDAEEAFLLVQNDNYKSEYCYLSWLARTCIIHFRLYLSRSSLLPFLSFFELPSSQEQGSDRGVLFVTR